MSRAWLWGLWALSLSGCAEELQPVRGIYCLDLLGARPNLRAAAYWTYSDHAELAVDQGLEEGFCLEVPPPITREGLSAAVIIELWEADYESDSSPRFHFEAHAPVLVVYEDRDQNQWFSPPREDKLQNDRLFGISYGFEHARRTLRWIPDYHRVLQSIRDNHGRFLEMLSKAQPRPGIPLIYSRESSTYPNFERMGPKYRNFRADYPIDSTSPPSSTLPLLKIDPWCEAESSLTRCGALTRTQVSPQSDWGDFAEIWHAPSLSEAIRDDAYLDADYPSIDRFALSPGSDIWPGREDLECYEGEGITIAIHARFYRVEVEDPCDCVAEAKRVAVATRVDDLPPWWPCVERSAFDDAPRSLRYLAPRIGLTLPTAP